MKKYLVLSVNSNVDYFYFVPLTIWTWRRHGWDVILFYEKSHPINEELEKIVFLTSGAHHLEILNPISGYRSDTITQISRLYASCFYWMDDKSYIMTGDIDMLALSNYWNPDPDKVTVYGHDLTGFTHFPICYIGMKSKEWHKVINAEAATPQYHIERDLKTLPQAKESTEWEKRWFADQDLITQRLKEYGTSKIDFINRGQYANGYAKGRVDRGAWTLEHEQFIDAHLFQQTWQNDEKVRKTLDLLETVWPEEDFQWFRNYTAQFRKLAV